MATDYRGESVNPTFATKEQLDYARQMAKYLQSKDNKFHMTPGMAVLPGSWMHGIGPNFIDQLASADYNQIAGQGDLQIRSQAQGLPSPATRPTTGDSLTNMVKGFYNKIKGGVSPGTEPGADPKDITTGSIGQEGETVQPAAPKVNYADEVKKIENNDLFSGKVKESRAKWDFQQHTNGFGTKARPDEIGPQGKAIDAEESHRRFGGDWEKAQNQVDQFKPGLPAGPRAALTSLTFNSGTKWMDSGLGAAVQSDDAEKAKELFSQYNKVKDNKTGEYYIHAGLKERRAKEANWFDDVTPTMGGMPQAPNDKLTGQMNLGGPPESPSGAGGPGAPMPLGGPVPPADPIVTGAIPPTGPKLAQAFGTQGPANNLPPNSNPNPPLLKPKTPSQLDAQVRSVPLDEIGKVIEGHRNELKGEDIQTPFGVTRAIPDPKGQGNNKYIGMPNKTIPITIGNMTLHQIPDGKGGMKLVLPTGEDATLENLNLKGAELQRQKDAVQEVGKAQLAPVTNAIELGASAPKAHQTLGAMEALVRSSKDLSMGPTSTVFNQVKRGLSNFFPGMAKDIDAADSLEKLNSLLASESTHAVSSNRGTNFELQTFIRANPNLAQSKEGMLMMLDILKQEKMQQKELGQIANNYRTKDPSMWQARQEEYYSEKPIIIHRPLENGKIQEITTKPINTKEERDALPKGMGYIRPDGSVGYRP